MEGRAEVSKSKGVGLITICRVQHTREAGLLILQARLGVAAEHPEGVTKYLSEEL